MIVIVPTLCFCLGSAWLGRHPQCLEEIQQTRVHPNLGRVMLEPLIVVSIKWAALPIRR